MTSKRDNSGADQLLEASVEAVDVLLGIMRSDAAPYVRLLAAKAVLDCGELSLEVSTLKKAAEVEFSTF